MAVFIYSESKKKFYPLVDNNIVKNGNAYRLKDGDQLVLRHIGYNISDTVPPPPPVPVTGSLWENDKNGNCDYYLLGKTPYSGNGTAVPNTFANWSFITDAFGIRAAMIFKYDTDGTTLVDNTKLWKFCTCMPRSYDYKTAAFYAMEDNGQVYEALRGAPYRLTLVEITRGSGNYLHANCITGFHSYVARPPEPPTESIKCYAIEKGDGITGQIYRVAMDEAKPCLTTNHCRDLTSVLNTPSSGGCLYNIPVTIEGEYLSYLANVEGIDTVPELVHFDRGNWRYLCGNLALKDNDVYKIVSTANAVSVQLLHSFPKNIRKISGAFNGVGVPVMTGALVLAEDGDLYRMSIDTGDVSQILGTGAIIDIRNGTHCAIQDYKLGNGYALDSAGKLYKIEGTSPTLIGQYIE